MHLGLGQPESTRAVEFVALPGDVFLSAEKGRPVEGKRVEAWPRTSREALKTTWTFAAGHYYVESKPERQCCRIASPRSGGGI